MKYVLLEMDRILRPNGYAIIRESSYFVDTVATIAKGMRWGCRKEDTEYSVEKEKMLICQKKIWYSSDKSSWSGVHDQPKNKNTEKLNPMLISLLEGWAVFIPWIEEAKGSNFNTTHREISSFL